MPRRACSSLLSRGCLTVMVFPPCQEPNRFAIIVHHGCFRVSEPSYRAWYIGTSAGLFPRLRWFRPQWPTWNCGGTLSRKSALGQGLPVAAGVDAGPPGLHAQVVQDHAGGVVSGGTADEAVGVGARP